MQRAFRVDVDMGAKVRAAFREREADLPFRLPRGIDPDLAPDAPLILDSIGDCPNQRPRRGEQAGMSKHVAVLMGGWSAEREVSLRSGRACAEALTRQGYQVTRIDVGRDIASVLTTVKPDVALNVLHGRPGEDGTLQGILEILAIPYTHCGVMSSAVVAF